MDDLAAVGAKISEYLEWMHGKEARWCYFQKDNGPMFVYTVEPYHLRYGGAAEGKYESVVYVPHGKGSRSGAARRWEVVDESRSLHALRKDARARAVKLYRAYNAGERRPWSA
jgi:hypothetical protein